MSWLNLSLRKFLAIGYKMFWSGVFSLLFGREWLAKHKQYSKFDLLRHLFEIWFAGFMVSRVGKIAQARLPGDLVAFVPFDVAAGIITREIFIDEVYDHFYHLQNDDIVIDIGAHVGLFTLKVAKKVKLVVAVEPHLLNHRLLVLNIALNKLENVIPVKLALSHYSGKAKLYVGKDSGTYTLRGNLYKLKSDDTIEVMVETLDRLVDRLGLD